MATTKKFPNLIHVVREQDRDSTYLSAYEDGVSSIDAHGTEVAIYKLVSVGRVNIAKTFQERKARAR